MDKIIFYQKIIVEVLEENLTTYDSKDCDLRDLLISDCPKNNFLLITVGWNDNHYTHMVKFHFEIKENGKVWLLLNDTDVMIAEELVNKGVLKSDIVLGFRSPKFRHFTDFATA
jgi:XisI protein